MNIQDLREKCNTLGKSREFFTGLIIILVGTASFGLGRLSMAEDSRKPVQIQLPDGTFLDNSTDVYVPENQSATVQNGLNMGNYVASKSGSAYHLPWCSGAQRIKEENKIWFDTKKEAEKAGYKPAGNCKGI